jgi:hypothetical protein
LGSVATLVSVVVVVPLVSEVEPALVVGAVVVGEVESVVVDAVVVEEEVVDEDAGDVVVVDADAEDAHCFGWSFEFPESSLWLSW